VRIAALPIKLDDLLIDDNQLTSLTFESNQDILFRGRALDDEGDNITRRLSRFIIGELVEVKAERGRTLREGVYRIAEIEIPKRQVKETRAIHRFSGILRPVH
jgi:hypothetical protein